LLGECADYATSVVSATTNRQVTAWLLRFGDEGAFTATPTFETTTIAARDSSMRAMAAARTASLQQLLYSTVPGGLCPRELAAAGEINSVLGEVLQTPLPLRFAYAPGNAAVTATGGGADGPAVFPAIAPSLRACGSFIYAVDSLLELPEGAASAIDSAALTGGLEAWAARMRRRPSRYMVRRAPLLMLFGVRPAAVAPVR
jgi:hypothetical protein